MTPDFKQLWSAGFTFEDYLAASSQHRGLWEGIHRLARIPGWAVAAVPPGTNLRLLVISEDWCGDASNTVPVLAKWAEQTPGLELRIVRRDENRELMNRYLTNGSRSIPIVILLDQDFREIGHWGPRPSELQAWVMEHRATTPKPELYPQVRRWYAKDKGETTLREVLDAAGLAVAGVA
ncbi:MAG: thioredoxin family protein [Gemmatimonadales bacterium]